MPYIGPPAPDRFVAPKAAKQFSGDGSTTAFTLDHAVGSDEDILVSVDGVIQEPSVAYAVSSGTTLTFTAAPSSNSGNNIFVYYLFRTVGTVSHPSNNALTATTGTFTGAFTSLGIDDNADATAITIDSDENVAIGVTSKNSANNGSLTIGHTGMTKVSASASGNADELVLIGADASANVGMSIIANNANDCNIFMGDEDDTDIGGIIYSNTDNSLEFICNTAERARFDNGGRFLIGKTASNNSVGNPILQTQQDNAEWIGLFENTNTSAPYGHFIYFTGAAPDNLTARFLQCQDNAAVRLQIYSDGDIYNHDGTYAQFSDERIKDNITDAKSQWDDIKAMRFVNYQRKDDILEYGKDKAKVQLGLIGQELEKVSPNLVRQVEPNADDIRHSSELGTLYQEGDDIPEDKKVGDVKEVKDKVKGVAYSILYMKAVKALQEAMARIETLEAKVTALESK